MTKKTNIVRIRKNKNHKNYLKLLIIIVIAIIMSIIITINFYDVTIFFNNINYLKNIDFNQLFPDNHYMTGKPDPSSFNTEAGPSKIRDSMESDSGEAGPSKIINKEDNDISNSSDSSETYTLESKAILSDEYPVEYLKRFGRNIFWTEKELNPPPSKPVRMGPYGILEEIDLETLNINKKPENNMDVDIESLDKGKRKATTIDAGNDNEKSSTKIRKIETEWGAETKKWSSEFKKEESNQSIEYKQWREDMFKQIDDLNLKKEEDKANRLFKSLINIMEKDEYRKTYRKFWSAWLDVHDKQVDSLVDRSKDHRWGPLFPLEGEPELKYSREEYKFALGYVGGNYNQAELDAIIEAKYRFEEIKQIAPYINEESIKIGQEAHYLSPDQFIKRYEDLESLRIRQRENQIKDQEFRTMLSKTTRYYIDQMYWSKNWPPEKPK